MTLPLPPPPLTNALFQTPLPRPLATQFNVRHDSCLHYDPPRPTPFCDKDPSFVPSCGNCKICISSAKQKRTDLIDRLVETSTEIIDSIWTNTTESPSSPYQQSKLKVVSTRDFIREILRRSKTTYSNLQVCLFYLFRVKKAVLIHLEKMELQHETKSMEDNMISCGRRMFLASLMVAAKFLQDKNYRNRAWSRLSGLALSEINAAEITFLKLINYNLYISKPSFDRWYSLLHSYLYRQPSQQQPHHQVSFYQTQPCLTCYNMTHRTDTPTCMMCYYIQCNDGSPCFSSSLHHPLDQRSPSLNLAYPSPPSDDLNSAPLTPPRDLHQRRNKRRMMVDDDGDQDPFNIKRACFDIQ